MKSWLNKASSLVENTTNKILETAENIDTQQYQQALNRSKDYLIDGANQVSSRYNNIDFSQLLQQAGTSIESMSSSAKHSVNTFLEKYQTIDNSDAELSEEEKIKKSIEALDGKDRVGLLGEAGSAVLGGLAGAGAAGTIASAAGASTILGSSALGSALGGVFVASTPVGWVIGSALVLGAAGYGAAKLVRSGSEQDKVRAELIDRLKERLDSMSTVNTDTNQLDELKQLSAICVAGGVLSEDNLDRMLSLIGQGKMKPELAISRLKNLASEANLIDVVG
jgi:hypothetical protein